MIVLPESEEINVRMLLKIFDDMTNSYKLFWFKGLFDEVIRGKEEIYFIDIISGMIANSWYPKLKYHLNFGTQDKLGICINNINKNSIKNIDINKFDLYRIISEGNKNREIYNEIKFLYKYVPYRAISPFFEEELKGKKYGIKNKLIEELSLKSDNVLYKLDSKNEKLYINLKWKKYILENQGIISGWIKYKLIEYLQRKNPNTPAIINKLEPQTERDLSISIKLWKGIICASNELDIYTGNVFNESNYKIFGNVSIDHFIPWSFIGHDMIWNLVPTFKNVNSSKSDNLPNLDKYFDCFLDKQIKLIEYLRQTKGNIKVFEDYFAIDSKLDIRSIIDIKNELNILKIKDDIKKTITPLYQIAYNQGFNIWEYKEKSYIAEKDLNYKEVQILIEN